GVVFSWVLLFWTSKREVPRPPQEGESSFASNQPTKRKAIAIEVDPTKYRHPAHGSQPGRAH
ncbi:MAG TPA: hypothetical protein VGV14_08590, partial [Rhodanobacter sp.]|nr:hypothetical protein [Rhodanobacter sp.]